MTMSPVVEENIFKLLPWAVSDEEELENIHKKTRQTLFFSPSPPGTLEEGRPVTTPVLPSFPPPCVPHVLEEGEGESDTRSVSENYNTGPLHICPQVNKRSQEVRFQNFSSLSSKTKGFSE